MATPLKLIERFNTICIGILGVFFIEIDKPTLTSIWKRKGPRIAKTIEEKNKDGGLTFLYFKSYFKTQ